MGSFEVNPVTGQLDLVGASASYINGTVATPADLPVTVGNPALDSVYLCKAGSGLWLVNRRPAGLYCRTGNAGTAADWTHLGAFPEVNSSANWALYDGTTPSKELKFDLSAISASTVRTLTVPNASGRIQVEGQPIGNTTPAAGTFTTLTANNGTLTASAPVLDLAQTWNNAAVAFTGLRLNVTNTASVGTSYLQEWQEGGVTQAAIRTGGFLYLRSGRIASPVGVNWAESAAFLYNAQSRINSTSLLIGSGSSGAGPLGVTLATEGNVEHVLALRNALNPQTLRIYGQITGTDVSATGNYERGFMRWSAAGGVFQIGTEQGSGGGTARDLAFQTGGTTRFTIAANGNATIGGGLPLGWGGGGTRIIGATFPAALLQFQTGSTDRLTIDANGIIGIGGTTASFPALKRSSTVLQARLANDSDFCPLQGQLRIHQNAVSETITATHTLTLFDAAGTAYKVPCVAA
jgi:hypothetical protein